MDHNERIVMKENGSAIWSSDGSLNRNQRGHGSYSSAEKKRLTLKPLEACTVQGEPCLCEILRGTLHNTRD